MERWLQIHGDPAVRRFLFEQERVPSECDRHLDRVLAGLTGLLTERGVFQAEIHFAACRLTLWTLTDPLCYRVHLADELLEGRVWTAYPQTGYPRMARVPQQAVAAVLAQFKRLRTQDPQMYLRAASLNLVNGYVALTFSCDGSHYVSYADFLTRAGEVY